jgi:hypothetical protein
MRTRVHLSRMARNPKTTKASSKKHKKATPRRKAKTPTRATAVIPPDSDSSSSAAEAAQLSPDPAAQDHFSDVDGSPSVHSSPRASHQTDRSSERNSPFSSPSPSLSLDSFNLTPYLITEYAGWCGTAVFMPPSQRGIVNS